MNNLRPWLGGALLGSTVAWLAYRKSALSPGGALAAAAVGSVAFARGGLPAAAALLAFFTSSSALSRLDQRRKEQQPLAQAKGGRRDAWQVAANGGVATVSLLLGGRRGRAACVGALAAAAADTWATEVGLTARRQPRLITTLRPVAAGTSGGVTVEGLLASAGGASVVGLAWTGSSLMRSTRSAPGLSLKRILAAGMVGSLVDSFIGATLQALYWCEECGQATEEEVHRRCGRPAQLTRGLAWINNDIVNVLATLAGAGVAAALTI